MKTLWRFEAFEMTTRLQLQLQNKDKRFDSKGILTLCSEFLARAAEL